MSPIVAYVIDLALLVSLGATTLAIVGMYRFEDPYVRLHSVSNSTFAGSIPLLAVILMADGTTVSARTLVVALFLLIVLPVSIHLMGRAHYLRQTANRPGQSEGDDAGHRSSD